MPYRWNNRFYLAVCDLASGVQDIQERLGDAYSDHLMHLKPEELPEDHQAEFRQICDRLTSVKAAGDEGSIRASARTLSNEEASEMARNIVAMFNGIAGQDWREG